MISKSLAIPYCQYKGSAVRITKTIPATVDEFVIGINSKQGCENKLTVFRDAAGNIIERCYDIIGKPLRNILYSKVENVIGEEEFVETTTTKEYEMPKWKASSYRDKYQVCDDNIIKEMFWRLISLRNNHLSTNIKRKNWQMMLVIRQMNNMMLKGLL